MRDSGGQRLGLAGARPSGDERPPLASQEAEQLCLLVGEVDDVGLPTGPAGSLTLGSSFPNGVPPGVPIFLQYWIVDSTGPQGLTASNALTAKTQ